MSVTETRRVQSKLLTRQAAWVARNPEKRRAHDVLNYALRCGRITRLPCAECGSPQSEAHHPNGYDEEHWLDVEWLCRRHHKERHRRKIVKGPKEKGEQADPARSTPVSPSGADPEQGRQPNVPEHSNP